jgi:outer membrane lipoprotein-sorting protein
VNASLLRPLACAFAVVLVLASGAPARADAPELAAVLKQLSGIAALSLRFREEKRMALLAEPLSSEGVLHYQKPRLLVRHTERPRKGSVLLRGDTLSFGNAKQAQSMALSSQPALRVLVDTFVSVLGGDREALERVATVTLEPRPEGAYRIRVVPKDDKVKRLVQTMSFDGKGALLTRMELLDASGDTTVTTFGDVVLRKPFSEAERARLFRIAK